MKTYKQFIRAIAKVKTIEDVKAIELALNEAWNEDRSPITSDDLDTMIQLLDFARDANNLPDDSWLR